MRDISARYEAGTVAARGVKFVVVAVVLAAILPLIGCSNRRMAKSATDQVDQLFAKWNKSDSPGCSLGISRNGAVVYEHGYGIANLDLGVAITPASVFDAASVSKQFTAMSILLLAQRGQLSLDGDVGKYISKLGRSSAPYYHSPSPDAHERAA